MGIQFISQADESGFSLSLFQGWIECVGCADRACYDLTQHSIASGEKLVAQVDLPSPISFSELRRNASNQAVRYQTVMCGQRSIVFDTQILKVVLFFVAFKHLR